MAFPLPLKYFFVWACPPPPIPPAAVACCGASPSAPVLSHCLLPSAPLHPLTPPPAQHSPRRSPLARGCWLLLMGIFVCCSAVRAQYVDCLPLPRTWQTEYLQGRVQTVWETERLPNGDIWEVARQDFDSTGLLLSESRHDTARHLNHIHQVEYLYTATGKVHQRIENETQWTKGNTTLHRHNQTVTYGYDKYDRFLTEQRSDSDLADTTYLQFLYRAGGWIDACRLIDPVKLRYDLRQPLVSYRYNYGVCVEKIDYLFADHARQQLFFYDKAGRLSDEKRLYLSRNTEGKKDTLARFHLHLDYLPQHHQPLSLHTADYYQKTQYYDAIPADRRYTYLEWDTQGNWLKATIHYTDQQIHPVERRITYWK